MLRHSVDLHHLIFDDFCCVVVRNLLYMPTVSEVAVNLLTKKFKLLCLTVVVIGVAVAMGCRFYRDERRNSCYSCGIVWECVLHV